MPSAIAWSGPRLGGRRPLRDAASDGGVPAVKCGRLNDVGSPESLTWKEKNLLDAQKRSASLQLDEEGTVAMNTLRVTTKAVCFV